MPLAELNRDRWPSSPKPAARRLVELGQALFLAPKKFMGTTKVPEADALLNDIENYPHFFVLACVMDRQFVSEKVWLIPYKISLKIGSPSFDAFSSLSQEEIRDHMSRPESLHRFVEIMSKYLFLAIGAFFGATRPGFRSNSATLSE